MRTPAAWRAQGPFREYAVASPSQTDDAPWRLPVLDGHDHNVTTPHDVTDPSAAALLHALASDAFSVVYQPIVRVADGTPIGLEALVRWHHPRGGELLPAAFIPAAERTGLIVPIGMRVLADACRHTASLRHRPGRTPLRLAVNVSACQLVQFGLLVPTLRVLLAEVDMAPSEIILEITETRMVAHGSPAMAGLRALHDMGVGIAIDDFGTGFSSLSYLKSFPPGTMLKMDRAFTAGLGTDPADRAITSAVVDLAAAMGLETVAEGVETETQLEVLRELGCTLAQGRLLAPPLLLAELPAALSRLETAALAASPPPPMGEAARELRGRAIPGVPPGWRLTPAALRR